MNSHMITVTVLMIYTGCLFAMAPSVSNLLCELRQARWLQEQPSVWDTVHKSAVSDQLVELGKTDQVVRSLLTREFVTCFTLFTDSTAALQYAYRLQRTMELIDPCLLGHAVSNAMVSTRWPVQEHGTLLWFLESTRQQESTRAKLHDYDRLCRNIVVHCATAGTVMVQSRALACLITPDAVSGLPGLDPQLGKQLAIEALNRAKSLDDQFTIVRVLSANKETQQLAAEWLRQKLANKTLAPVIKLSLCKLFEEHGIVSTQDMQAVRSAVQRERDALLDSITRNVSEGALRTNSNLAAPGAQTQGAE